MSTSEILSFNHSDLHFNQQGDLSEQQRQQLAPYIDTQSNAFLGHLMIVGSYFITISLLVMAVFTGDAAAVGADVFVVIVMVAIIVGAMVVPYSAQQTWRSFIILQKFRTNCVEQHTGICEVQSIQGNDMVIYLYFDDDGPCFILPADTVEPLIQPGHLYTAYYLGDVLLAFERT